MKENQVSVEIGQVLKNGYKVLYWKAGRDGCLVVLAKNELNQKYATWIMNPEGATILGHYFHVRPKMGLPHDLQLAAAIRDFKIRL